MYINPEKMKWKKCPKLTKRPKKCSCCAKKKLRGDFIFFFFNFPENPKKCMIRADDIRNNADEMRKAADDLSAGLRKIET